MRFNIVHRNRGYFMGLKLVYGRAGSGKSHYCLQEIRAAIESDVKQPLIMIVPEQYSMQAEKNLVKVAPGKGSINAQVLSFRRMAYRVFGEVGGLTRRHISSTGKSMLLYRIID